jgi:hypothetical protein
VIVMPAPAEVVLVSDAALGGVGRRSLARAAEAGELVRVRRGAYVRSTEWDALDPTARHLVRLHAAQACFDRPLVFSHWSAAVLLGLPALLTSQELLHVSVPPETARSGSGFRHHLLPLTSEDVIEVDGLRCTRWERTVVDLAAAAPFADAVAAADAALHRLDPAVRPLGKQALLAAWRRAQPRRERGKVTDVIDFADARSESVGESISRCTMRLLRVPPPELQHVFVDSRGRLIARVDFWWPKVRVAGEMDGRMKYLDPRLSGGDPARVVYEEKRREDEVRSLDVRFARWGWEEAGSAALLRPRLAAVGVVAP